MTDREAPIMKCGHSANAVCRSDGINNFDPPIPSCVICSCCEIDESPPDLSNRKAQCAYSEKRDGGKHGDPVRSDTANLAFFMHRPDREFDEYYCGCWGWD